MIRVIFIEFRLRMHLSSDNKTLISRFSLRTNFLQFHVNEK